MARAATDRLKVNPQVGAKPALRWLRLDEMFVDYSYQRTLDAPQSQTLIRQIAQFWDWSLCQPLTVAKRPNGSLMIVDGQHRHAAAKLRGDMETLPCVVIAYANAGDEAAAFVALNSRRRALTAIDLFKAALTANDPEATAVMSAITDAGLKVATSSNLQTIRAGSVSNIGGLLRCYRQAGEPVLRVALQTLAKSYPGQVLQYAGTIFPGLAAVVKDELRLRMLADDIVAGLTKIAASKTQEDWRREIKAAVGESGGMAREASEMLFRRYWRISRGIIDAPIAAPIISSAKPCRQERRPLSFEEQLAAVNNGAKLIEKTRVPSVNPTHRFGGAPPERL